MIKYDVDEIGSVVPLVPYRICERDVFKKKKDFDYGSSVGTLRTLQEKTGS